MCNRWAIACAAGFEGHWAAGRYGAFWGRLARTMLCSSPFSCPSNSPIRLPSAVSTVLPAQFRICFHFPADLVVSAEEDEYSCMDGERSTHSVHSMHAVLSCAGACSAGQAPS